MAASVIQNHPHCSTISGALSVLYVTILAIEFDIPWNDEQVATYGESFRAWGAEDFKNALAPILRAIPYNKIAIVVTISPFVFILLGLPFIRSTRVRQHQLRTSFKSVHD